LSGERHPEPIDRLLRFERVAPQDETNSSPPYRAKKSHVRTSVRHAAANSRSSSSPAGCPKRSLTSLKPSRSAIATHSRHTDRGDAGLVRARWMREEQCDCREHAPDAEEQPGRPSHPSSVCVHCHRTPGPGALHALSTRVSALVWRTSGDEARLAQTETIGR
jgi:hypothetical protein